MVIKFHSTIPHKHKDEMLIRLSVCSDIRGYHDKFCLAGERGATSTITLSTLLQFLKPILAVGKTTDSGHLAFVAQNLHLFAAYNWTTRPSKISSVQRVEPGIAP